MKVLVTAPPASPAAISRGIWLRAGDDVRALVRADADTRGPRRRSASTSSDGRPHRRGQSASRARRASRSSTTSPRSIARPACPAREYRAVNADGGRRRSSSCGESGGRPARRALQHGRRARRHRASAGERRRAAAARRRLSGDEARRRADRRARPPARVGMELVIARPTGIYGPGDRRLFKVFGADRAAAVRHARDRARTTTTSPTSTISATGFRLCGTVPAAAGRTYILAGGEVTTLRRAGATHRGGRRRAAAARRGFPSGRSGWRARCARRSARRSGSRRRSTGGV